MWLSRFGRTVGAQVTDAVSGRLAADLAPGAHATLAGQPLDLSRAGDATALGETLTGLARAFGAPDAPAANAGDPFGHPGPGAAWGDAFARPDPGGAWVDDPVAGTSAPARSMPGRELLLGSSFHLALDGDQAGPALTAWGRVAHGSFEGEEAADSGPTGIDGEVMTGTLGVDADWGGVLAGVAVSLSEGEGGFEQPGVDAGRIESTLTTVSPYAKVEVSGRVTAWGLAGFGAGDMTITQDAREATGTRPARAETVTTSDLSMQLGAIGARGALLEQQGSSGMDLVLKTDAFFVRMESDAAANSAATTADASRVRLVLEGGRAFALSETATLRPSLELGLRHDGGDAETGAGLEVGGGLAWTDVASGLSLEATARVLVAHADADYDEWGASAVARFDPGERGRGLSFSLSPTIGATSSASERLWSAHDARALAPGGAFQPARGLQAEAGYGIALPGGFIGTPNLGFGSSAGARDWRVGWRLTPAVPGGFEVNLDAVRRETAGGAAAEHGVMLRSGLRW